MAVTRERVVIAAGVRTPIGRFGGGLKDVPARELAGRVIAEGIRRAGVAPEEVDEVVLGCVGQYGDDGYIARTAALTAGLPQSSTAYTVNRICGSGLQAVVTAAQAIRTGDARIAVAGGVETMSRFPYFTRAARWGVRLGHDTMLDAITEALSDPFDRDHMGVTAERLAERHGITREAQDAFALESHRRAVHAWENGYFDGQVLAIEVGGKKPTVVERDEGPRADTSMERLARLPAVFQKGGTVTAGNASTINDGAAAVVLMSEEEAERRGVEPLGYLAASAVCGVDPRIMGIGPVPSSERVLQRAGWSWDDVDLIELNEAFAAQALAVMAHWPDEVAERVNVNGGAIAHGHPIGATGAILTVKLLYEMARRGVGRGMVTLCIGGGQGISALFERP